MTVSADAGSTGDYQAKYGTTIFGKLQAAGNNDDTAKNAGLNLRMTPTNDGTTGISKVSVGANYLVKLASSADDSNYALGVLGTTATLTSTEGFSLSEGQTFTMAYDTYAVTKSTGKETTVALNDHEGKELISYTYEGKTGKITAVQFYGTPATNFSPFSVNSLKSKSADCGTLADLTVDTDGSHKNARITLTVKADGEASLSVIRDAKTDGEAINKTYTGTVGENAIIKSFTISNGSSEDGSRAYTIDNLTTTITSPDAPTPEPTPTIMAADKYEYDNNPELANSDVVGFTASFTAENAVNSLTWYLRKDKNSAYKFLTDAALPEASGESTTEFKVGLIVYDLADAGVTADTLEAGYSYASCNSENGGSGE